MNAADTVSCRCPMCEKIVERPIAKAGGLYECGQCKKVLKSPSIATQYRATFWQISEMEEAVKRGDRALMLCFSLAVIITTYCFWCPSCMSEGIRFLIGMVFVIIGIVAFVKLVNAGCQIASCFGWPLHIFKHLAPLVPVWIIIMALSMRIMRSTIARSKELGPRRDFESP